MTGTDVLTEIGAVLATLCAGSVGWLVAGGGPGRITWARRGGHLFEARPGLRRFGPPTGWRLVPPSGHRVPAYVATLLGTGVVLVGSDTIGLRPAVALPLCMAIAVAGTAARWLTSQARSRGTARRVRAEVVEACEALAAGLRAGLSPERVLARTAEDVPLLVPAATAARLGGDVPGALRSAAAAGGADRLTMLAAAWEVARRSGAGLAGVVTRIAAMVRADEGRRRQVDAALGGARSTARLFAVLPVLGVALGAGMDADPIGVMTSSAAGAWCLCLGTTLAALGLVWVEWLAKGAAV